MVNIIGRASYHDSRLLPARVAFDVRLFDEHEPILLGSAEDTGSEIQDSEAQARCRSS